MKLSIIAIGTKMPGWVQTGFSEYEKRLPREWKPNVRELALAKRGKNHNSEQSIALEGSRILSLLTEQQHVIALDVQGQKFDTPMLSKKMAAWQREGNNVSILIGGPDGLSESCLRRANERWSLSDFTLPHPLVRVVLIEQVYRAWTILHNHPYHK